MEILGHHSARRRTSTHRCPLGEVYTRNKDDPEQRAVVEARSRSGWDAPTMGRHPPLARQRSRRQLAGGDPCPVQARAAQHRKDGGEGFVGRR
jgi:hypothetical protein